MYLCLRCKSLFSEPKKFYENHNLDTPPYEEWSGCPYCYGTYVETRKCKECEDYITDDRFYEMGDNSFCQNCFTYEIKLIEDLR